MSTPKEGERKKIPTQLRLRQAWLTFRASNGRFFVYGFLTGLVVSGLFLLFWINFNNIHLSLVEISRDGRIQYLTSIGAAILGVLAITFTLTVFALQHAADNGSARILESFGKNARVLFDYIFIGSMAFGIYILGLTPKTNGYFGSLSLLLSLVFITVVLWRVYAFYQFIVRFINPLEQVKKLSNESKKILSSARNTLLQIRVLEKPAERADTTSLPNIDPNDLFVTVNFDNDYIYSPYSNHVASLVDRMKIYAEKRRHEVTLEGYRELADIARIYFVARKYSPASSGIFVHGSRTDQYLILLLEHFKTLFSQLVKLEDQEGIQQNFFHHTQIAIYVCAYKVLGTDPSNPNLDLVTGYLHHNLLEAITKKVDDAVLNGIRYLKSIIAHVPSAKYLSMRQLASQFKEEAMASITLQKWFLTQEAVSGLVDIVSWSLNDSFAAHTTLKPTLRYLEEIAESYVSSGLTIGVNGGGLSSAIATVNPKSIPYILNRYLVQVYREKGTFDIDIFKTFCAYYEALGRVAAAADSFLMHFVTSALSVHLDQLVQMRRSNTNESNFTEGIKIVLRSYKHIYSALPKNYNEKRFGHLEMERVKEVALWSAKENDTELFDLVAETFVHFYSQSREKTTDEYTALRIYIDLVELGAIASANQMTETADKIVDMATSVQEEQLKRFLRDGHPEPLKEEVRECLSREIWRLYADYHQYNPMRHDEIKLESLISLQDLMNYLNRIELLVYSRKITQRRSRMF